MKLQALPLKFSGAGIGLKSVVYHMKLPALPSAGAQNGSGASTSPLFCFFFSTRPTFALLVFNRLAISE